MQIPCTTYLWTSQLIYTYKSISTNRLLGNTKHFWKKKIKVFFSQIHQIFFTKVFWLGLQYSHIVLYSHANSKFHVRYINKAFYHNNFISNHHFDWLMHWRLRQVHKHWRGETQCCLGISSAFIPADFDIIPRAAWWRVWPL